MMTGVRLFRSIYPCMSMNSSGSIAASPQGNKPQAAFSLRGQVRNIHQHDALHFVLVVRLSSGCGVSQLLRDELSSPRLPRGDATRPTLTRRSLDSALGECGSLKISPEAACCLTMPRKRPPVVRESPLTQINVYRRRLKPGLCSIRPLGPCVCIGLVQDNMDSAALPHHQHNCRR